MQCVQMFRIDPFFRQETDSNSVNKRKWNDFDFYFRTSSYGLEECWCRRWFLEFNILSSVWGRAGMRKRFRWNGDESQPCDTEKTIQTQNNHNNTTLVPSVNVIAQGMFYGAKYTNALPVLLPCVVVGHSRNLLYNYYYTHSRQS